MARALFVVIQSRGNWWVDFEGKAYGPHETMDLAVSNGLELAKYCAHTGRRSEVLAPDERGRYSVLWDSGAEDSHDMAASHAA